MEHALFEKLAAAFPEREVRRYRTVDSTNEEAKRLIASGRAEHGMLLLGGEQTAGKGRLGREFYSPAGKGVYLSLLLQPQCSPEELPAVTPMAAVAVCRALEQAGGPSAKIKWPNDVICGGKKLCGILTEAVPTNGRFWVIVGVGLNLRQTPEDFGPELAEKAVSLAQLVRAADPDAVEEALLRELFRLSDAFPGGRAAAWQDYCGRCINIGKKVTVLTGNSPEQVSCEGVNEDFSLHVKADDGTERNISSGEVSVRGIYGYI